MTVALVAFGISAPTPARAQCSPVGPLGCWETWDFTCLIPVPPPGDHPQGAEFSHLALIPHGPYQGKVLLWRSQRLQGPNAGRTTVSYVFDPANPGVLLKIQQVLQSDIFCSGISWDKDGNLAVAGGIASAGSGLPPRQTYRFLPLALGGLIYAIPPPTPCGPQGVIEREILGQPWRQTGDMSVGRYYPGLITLCKGDVLSASNQCSPSCPDLPGSSSFVSGGRAVAYDSQGNKVEDLLGTDFWQLLLPYPGAWSHTLVSDLNDPLLQLPLPAAREEYRRKPDAAPVTDVILNNYPRGLQLRNIDDPSAPTTHAQNVFIANDVWPDTPPPVGNPKSVAGASWVVRMPLVGGSLASWELWAGPSASVGTQSNDRHYGDAVLMHTLQGGPSSNGRNRVLAFGGLHETAQGQAITAPVQEFRPGTNPAGSPNGSGTWVEKDHDLQIDRAWLNCVLLPTGKVLVVGGLRDPVQKLGAFEPELFDPGTAGEGVNQPSQLLATSPPAGGGHGPYTRGYHSLAALLPDGRVISAGGERVLDDPNNAISDEFSVQLFSPPYLGLPDRPQILGIETAEVSHGQGFWVDVDEHLTKPIERFVLLRPAARTHHFDSDQRSIELDEGAGTPLGGGVVRYALTAPAQDEAPLGYYMLFAVRQDQAPPNQVLNPSVAVFLRLR